VTTFKHNHRVTSESGRHGGTVIRVAGEQVTVLWDEGPAFAVAAASLTNHGYEPSVNEQLDALRAALAV
jgi:hypothetical protein